MRAIARFDATMTLGLSAGDYLQIAETPIGVLDPEVKGKGATLVPNAEPQ